jgi:hypothetical protein
MSNEVRKIRSLREMPQELSPPRDLWPSIEARLSEEKRSSAAKPIFTSDASRRAARFRVIAAAAVVAALAVGVWIGRNEHANTELANTQQTNTERASAGSETLRAAYLPNAKYTQDRAALVKSLEARLDALPPQTRAKVVSSLRTIQDSKRQLEAALGRDPSNALLQELLVNTYQDEMRVLTAVHEAGDSGKGI